MIKIYLEEIHSCNVNPSDMCVACMYEDNPLSAYEENELPLEVKAFLKNVVDMRNAVKDGYCDEETYYKRLSVYRSQLSNESVKVLKEMGISS